MQNKFRDHPVSPDTKILLLGTFHPDIRRAVTFFYCEPGNFLWSILPLCFNDPDLHSRPLAEKKQFLKSRNIDFADLVASVSAEDEDLRRYYGDDFIEAKGLEWNDTEGLIDRLDSLEAVYFTRKTFGRLPVIEKRVMEIRNHWVGKCIRFCLLEGPTDSSEPHKIENWKDTMIHKNFCR